MRRRSIPAALLILTSLLTTSAASVMAADPTIGWKEVNPDAEWSARAGLQVLESRGRFFLMGGRTPLDPAVVPVPGASTIWGDVWSSADRGRSWRKLTDDAWPARAYFQAVTKNGSMYVLGGQDFTIIPNPACAAFLPGPCPPFIPPMVPRSEFFNDVWRSSNGRDWSRVVEHAPWEGRAGLSSVVLGDWIYVMGGSKNDDSAIVGPGGPARVYFNDVWRSRDGETWQQMTSEAEWAARAGAAVVAKDGYIYLLGGEDGFVCNPSTPRCPPYFNDVWRSRDGAQWQQVTPAAGWSARPGHQCVVAVGRIVCFGGFGLPTNPTDMWASRDGMDWVKLRSTAWGATSPDQVKYDFDALVSYGPLGLPSIYTFGGDRETFDFGNPLNYQRVDNDVWRFGVTWTGSN